MAAMAGSQFSTDKLGLIVAMVASPGPTCMGSIVLRAKWLLVLILLTILHGLWVLMRTIIPQIGNGKNLCLSN